MDGKEIAARSAVASIHSGMVVGLGSGSTSLRAIEVIAERMRTDGLLITGVATSSATERAAEELGIPLTTLDEHPELDLAVDGADQIDGRLTCIKGYGGALLREKIVARCAKRFLVMVDPSKLSPVLDKAVPVEVLPYASGVALRHLEAIGGRARVRPSPAGGPFVTDNGNHVFDVEFGRITAPARLAAQLAGIPGVADHGLFVGLVDELHIGEPTGPRIVRAPK